jgi:hypothetical protein
MNDTEKLQKILSWLNHAVDMPWDWGEEVENFAIDVLESVGELKSEKQVEE